MEFAKRRDAIQQAALALEQQQANLKTAKDELTGAWSFWRTTVAEKYQLTDGDEVADDGTIQRKETR
jgi:hypothetical protein